MTHLSSAKKKNKTHVDILHLSQTNILKDGRIRKMLESAKRLRMTTLAIGMDRFGSDVNPAGINKADGVIDLKITSYSFSLLPRHLKNILSVFEFFFKALRIGLKAKPRIIHCNDVTPLPVAVVIKIFTGAKLVYDAHELESNKAGTGRVIGFLVFIVEKVLWRYIDALVTVSSSIQSWYIKCFGNKVTAVVLNSPDFDRFSIVKGDYLRSYFSIPPEKTIFVYVGILGPGRGLDLILSCFKCQENAALVVVGYGVYEEMFKKESRKYGNVYFHHSIPEEELRNVIGSADYGFCLIQNISLSDYYSLPNKLFQYIFSGVPVLASNFPDIKKLVDEYKVGKCIDLNEESIRGSVNDAVNDAVNAPKSLKFDPESLTNLSWRTQENILFDLYESLLDSNKE